MERLYREILLGCLGKEGQRHIADHILDYVFYPTLCEFVGKYLEEKSIKYEQSQNNEGIHVFGNNDWSVSVGPHDVRLVHYVCVGFLRVTVWQNTWKMSDDLETLRHMMDALVKKNTILNEK